MITGVGYYFYEYGSTREIFLVYKISKNNFRSRIIVSHWGVPAFKDDDGNVGFFDSSLGRNSKKLTSEHVRVFVKDIFNGERTYIERN